MKRLRIILLIAVLILVVAALVLSFTSCDTETTLDPPPPYSNCAEFVEYARSGEMFLGPSAEDIANNIWSDDSTGFDTTYVALVKVSAPSVLIAQHPEDATKFIELGIYCDTSLVYEEVFPGFKTSAVVFAHLKSWESNPNINITCLNGDLFTKITPIPNEDHAWCENDYSNWTLVTANIDCMCPYTPSEDPLDILCQWRQ